MKTYPKMKNSEVDWIGNIPEKWSSIRLRFLAKITTGEKDTIDNEKNGEYPFFVRSQKIEKISSPSYDEEAVLTAGDGVGVGKVFHYINGKFDFHQRVYKMSNFQKISGKYFYYYFKENFKKEVFKGTAKSTVDSLRRHMIQNFPVVFGSKQEQKQIVDFLDKKTLDIDSEITKNQKLIELLKEKSKNIINHVVTKGLTPITMKDSGIGWIGEIPKEWKIEPLKFHVIINQKVLNEDVDSTLKISYIDIGSIHEGGIIDPPEVLTFSEAPSRARRIISENDTILSTVRTYLKAIAFIDKNNQNYICSTGFAVITPRKEINPRFLYRLLSSEKYVETIMANSYGVTYPAINSSVIGTLPCILPKLNEQKQIVDFIDLEILKINTLISKIESQIKKLKEFRQSLITSAVTGKIDIRQEIIA